MPQAPDQYVGVIFARQLVDMVARSDRRLEAVHVHLGDHLKPGNVIAQLESSAIRQQLEMAEASLRSAQAEARSTNVELKDAEVRHSRREGLVKAGLISKEEVATAAVQVERARANLEVAQVRMAEQMARLKQTKEALANTVITATFEGTVAARYLDPGAMVHAGSSVDSMSREVVVEAKLHVPAVWRGQMKPGLSGYVVATSGQRSVAAPDGLLKSALQAR